MVLFHIHSLFKVTDASVNASAHLSMHPITLLDTDLKDLQWWSAWLYV